MTITGWEGPAGGQAPAEQAKKRRGCLRPGCLFKGGLGCLAFVVGGVFVLILLLPAALGSVASAVFEDEFGSTYAGSLDVGEVRASWVSPQRIEGLTLRDPKGAYVGSAEITLPALSDIFADLDRGAVGPVRFDLDLNLSVDDEGALNLERALALRRDGPGLMIEHRSSRSGATLDGAIEGVIGLWRASWSSPAVRATGRQDVVVVLDEGALVFPESGIGWIQARGELEGSRGGDAPMPLSMELRFDHLGALLGGRQAPVAWSWTVEGFPADLLGVIGPGPEAAIPYADAFGARIASVRMARLDEDGEVIELEARSPGVRLGIAGEVVRGDEPALVSGDADGRGAQVDFALEGFWRDEVVARLLPFLGGLEAAQPGAVARLELSALVAPLDGNFARLEAEARLDLGEVAYVAFPKRAGGETGWNGFTLTEARRVPPVRLTLSEGVVTLRAITLPVAGGEMTLAGTIDPVAGAIDLTATMPARMAAEALGEPVAGDEPVTLAVSGIANDGVVFRRE